MGAIEQRAKDAVDALEKEGIIAFSTALLRRAYSYSWQQDAFRFAVVEALKEKGITK